MLYFVEICLRNLNELIVFHILTYILGTVQQTELSHFTMANNDNDANKMNEVFKEI